MPPVAVQVLELESIRELLPGKQLLEIHALAQRRGRERQEERHAGETSHLLSPSSGHPRRPPKGKIAPVAGRSAATGAVRGTPRTRTCTFILALGAQTCNQTA